MSIVSKILLESRGVPSIIETIAEEASVEITKLVPKLYSKEKIVEISIHKYTKCLNW